MVYSGDAMHLYQMAFQSRTTPIFTPERVSNKVMALSLTTTKRLMRPKCPLRRGGFQSCYLLERLSWLAFHFRGHRG